MEASTQWLWLASAALSWITLPRSSASVSDFAPLSLITKLDVEARKRQKESGKDFTNFVRLSVCPKCPHVDLVGLFPQIKSLTWPDSASPLDLPGFETQARRLRYQALGHASREIPADWLLLAHHNDDQAETVLMRLALGHKGPGLQGMPSQAHIPECWGVHSVSRSGNYESVALRLDRLKEKDPSSPKVAFLMQALARQQIFEEGGVKIMRPLLEFSKARLIETCRARNLDWEEDKTNQDTWRTPRNSIRALLSSAQLPQALQKDSMLQLAKQKSDLLAKSSATAKRIDACCEILLFDIRCGGIVVRLPISTINTDAVRGPGGRYKQNARVSAMMLLRKFVQNITPYEDVSLQSLGHAVLSIFPSLNDEDTLADRALPPTNFTVGGVQFQRLHCPLATPRSDLDPPISGRWKDLDPVFVWSLTRQPFSKAPLSLVVQPPAKSESSVADISPSWSSWQLWDGRYWIRILNGYAQPLIVRSFQPSDLKYLRSTLSRQRYKDFHRFLHLAAPGKVRWTLLAIAEIEDESSPLGRLCALPTLGQAGIFDSHDANGTNKVEWQVRYKSVFLGYRLSDDGKSIIHRNEDLITSWLD